MSKSTSSVNDDLHRQIQDFCSHAAGSAQITAIILLDNNPATTSNAKTMLEVVAVIRDFQPRLLSYMKIIDSRSIIIFAVDQWVFDRDIDRGFLGEALAGTLLFPYSALEGKEYLHTKEILLKKRLILELLANLVLTFPELSYLIRVKPQYFMYETLLNRARVFPPVAYGFPSFMYGKLHKKDVDSVLCGYMEALEQLEKEKKIILSDGYVLIPKKFVMENKNSKVLLAKISKNAPRRLFTSLFGVFPQLLNFVSQNTEVFLKLQKISQIKEVLALRHFVDPQKYVFVPTSEGLVSLADRIDISDFAQKMLINGENAKITFERLGGVLNDVYLIKANSEDIEKKVLVKRFKEWSGFKWFPLTVWSFGTRAFSVLGRSRLEKECAISERLRCSGFNVPKVLHVSHNERLVFMEYIEGENLSKALTRIATAQNGKETEADLDNILRVGKTLAQVHSLNVVLGDTKPENVIVNRNGEIYLLDFEQASQGGDKSWDVAEFLYYAGHYLPLNSNGKAEDITIAFIRGYLSGGGNVTTVKKAGASKYTRVFSVFTLPSVIIAIANICKQAEILR